MFKEMILRLNMVIKAKNRNEIGEMVVIEERFGRDGVSLGYLMNTIEIDLRKIDV